MNKENKTKITVSVLLSLLFIVIMIFLVYYVSSIDYYFKKADINYEDVIHIEKINNNTIFFYKPHSKYNNKLGLLKLEKKKIGWSFRGDITTRDYQYFSIEDEEEYNRDTFLLYGVIYNTDVNDIKIIKNGQEQGYADITEKEGYKLWFFKGKSDGEYSFLGLNENGKVINK